jgi:hypothetical protein
MREKVKRVAFTVASSSADADGRTTGTAPGARGIPDGVNIRNITYAESNQSKEER